MLAISLAREQTACSIETYHETILLAEDGLVDVPCGVQMGQDDGTHDDSLREIRKIDGR